MQTLDFQTRTRVIFGEGALDLLGNTARELGFGRTLLVADRGLVAAGYVEQAVQILSKTGVQVFPFHDFDVNPDTVMVERGRAFAAPLGVDSLIGLGGGSSMDCAKAINFLLTNGGSMEDYCGYGKAAQPMLPVIAVPTTTGTGSEAQSYALIADARTKQKLACGDPKAAFRVALLDPCLAVSQPFGVRAAAGYDAISHAIESFVTTKRNGFSECFSREAWRLLERNYGRSLLHPEDVEAQGAMLLGAYFAGVAVEHSMLGATHACANPLTAHYGTIHGVAIAMLLPHVVRWNAAVVGARYAELLEIIGRRSDHPAEELARRLAELAQAGGMPPTLGAAGVAKNVLGMLAEEAALEWTGGHNPRPFDARGALEVYACAY